MRLQSGRGSIIRVVVVLGLGMLAPSLAYAQRTCDVTGTWIGKVPSNGNIFTETIIAEPGGNRWQFTLDGVFIGVDETLGGAFPGVGSGHTARGEAIRIGHNEYRFKFHVYGLVDNPPGQADDYVYVRVDEGVVRFTDCDTQQGLTNVSIYTAAQDADRDGFPDPGEVPVVSAPDLLFNAKRLSVD